MGIERRDLGVLSLVMILAFVYLSPGGTFLLSGRTDQVMSDGTDQLTAPYHYSWLNHLRQKEPSALVYGAVPSDRLNPPEGFALWIPWFERAVVVFGGMFGVANEQLSTFFVWILWIMNAMAFFALARALGWERSLALALSLAYAFSAYTRARAKVHTALVGIYHLPLIFLGLYLVAQRRDRRSLILASLAFLAAASVAHYYLLLNLLLVPIFLWAFWNWSGPERNWRALGQRSLLAVLPTVLFLLWNVLKPLPPHYVQEQTQVRVTSGDVKTGDVHPFLSRFAAQPIDFFTGELAIGGRDLNPLRAALSHEVLKSLGESNSHERSNGVRWSLWLALALAVSSFFWAKPQLTWSPSDRALLSLGLALIVLGFLAAIDPKVLGPLSPSLWLHQLFSPYRVPSRAGILVHFGVLLAAGTFLQSWLFARKAKALSPGLRFLRLGGVLPLLMILELPPMLNPMPMSTLTPARPALQASANCGYGMSFPYVSGTWGLLEYYTFLQSMRGTECRIVNAVSETASDRNRKLLSSFALHPVIMSAIERGDERVRQKLLRFAECVPLSWLAFDPRVPSVWKRETCRQLGWSMADESLCLAPRLDTPLRQLPESCL